MLFQAISTARSTRNKLRVAYWRMRGIDLSWSCRIEDSVEFVPGVAMAKPGVISAQNSQFSKGVILHAYGGSIRLAHNVYLGPYSIIYGHGGVEIGEHTLISMHCRILSSDHAIPQPTTTIRSQADIAKPTSIGRDVWLGAGVTVLGGVTIGNGCVVGAGAVVSKDLPAYSIAVGVPARVIGTRT